MHNDRKMNARKRLTWILFLVVLSFLKPRRIVQEIIRLRMLRLRKLCLTNWDFSRLIVVMVSWFWL